MQFFIFFPLILNWIQSFEAKTMLTSKTIRGHGCSHGEHSQINMYSFQQDFKGVGVRCSYLIHMSKWRGLTEHQTLHNHLIYQPQTTLAFKSKARKLEYLLYRRSISNKHHNYTTTNIQIHCMIQTTYTNWYINARFRIYPSLCLSCFEKFRYLQYHESENQTSLWDKFKIMVHLSFTQMTTKLRY